MTDTTPAARGADAEAKCVIRGETLVEEMARELRDGELRLELAGYEVNAVHHVPAWSFRMVHAESGEELGEDSAAGG